jgi:hypothetical protein
MVQTHGYVTTHTEIFGEARVVPLDERPHLPSTMRQWKGDSRGRWEGDTLIVETPDELTAHASERDSHLGTFDIFTSGDLVSLQPSTDKDR